MHPYNARNFQANQQPFAVDYTLLRTKPIALLMLYEFDKDCQVDNNPFLFRKYLEYNPLHHQEDE